MKRLLILFLLIAVPCSAQCVGEIKDVRQDEVRGSIIVVTEYKLNGDFVQLGNVRYDEGSGTNAEIIEKAKSDVEIHCESLVKRIEGNAIYLRTEKLKQQKAVTTPIIADIKDDLIGEKKTISEVTISYKGKDIKVTYDEQNTIDNTP